MNSANQIQKAIADINLIRRLVGGPNEMTAITKKTNILILTIALVIGLLALGYELFITDAPIDYLLKYTRNDAELKFGSIFYMGYTLVVVLISLYFVMWRAAKHEGEDLNNYIAGNFNYLKNLNLVSDLFLKFTTIALVIVSGAPQWISPLLLLFIGDYLIQGRLFVMPIRFMIGMGALCMLGAVMQMYFGVTTFLIPLAVFAVMVAVSILRVMKASKG